ncbi:MAG: phosphoribosylglycinamide formyltransferase [Proteobacteria bacterium]|nr:phosphoribosylglycinamide formyltransferase [Pseudomonadota bacterium]
MSSSFNICVFISGSGSNLAAILNKQTQMGYKVVLVVSNKANATGLNFAKEYNIPTYTFKWDKHDNKIEHLQTIIKQYQINLIVLAGFMRILPARFVAAFKRKIINIHPSLLPKYPGLHTHTKVLHNHDKEHGATVHYVNQELDAGQIITQTRIKVASNISENELSNKILSKEHSLYPYTIGLIAQNRVEWGNDTLYFDHQILTTVIEFNE